MAERRLRFNRDAERNPRSVSYVRAVVVLRALLRVARANREVVAGPLVSPEDASADRPLQMISGLARYSDKSCWCEQWGEAGHIREEALDELYPDRCQVPTSAGLPGEGRRDCVLEAGHSQPCNGSFDRPGGPCHFCSATYDGDSFPQCWQSLEGLPLAEIKSIFAAGLPELSLDPVVKGGPKDVG